MTKLRICGLFTSLLLHRSKTSCLEKLRLPATVCIVFLFCAAATIVAPAERLLQNSGEFHWDQ